VGGGGGGGSAFRAIGFGYGCNEKGDTRVKVWSCGVGGREGGDENGGVKRSESRVDGIQWQMEGREKSKRNADK